MGYQAHDWAEAKAGRGRGNAFPRLPLAGAAIMIVFAILAVAFAQRTGIGTMKADNGVPVEMRDIVLVQDPAKKITITDASSGQLIASFEDGEGAFVRGSLRAFERMRLVSRIAPDQPYRLIRWQNGAISLSDTGTGERFYLDAFGPDNAAAFAAILKQGPDLGR